jgi:hypothetical protein
MKNAIERRDRIRALETELKTLKREHHDEGYKTQPEARYTYSVHPGVQEDEHWSTKVPVGSEYILIQGKLANEDEKDAHMEIYGSINGDWKERRTSVKYFRMENILMHDGGGFLILKDPQHCNDEEWEELKKGNFGKFANESFSN